MLWTDQALVEVGGPVPRRRAYSDVQRRPPRLCRQRSVSPPGAKACPSARSASGDGLARSGSMFAGVVVGSPLGCGPLNGTALPLGGVGPPLGSSPPGPTTPTGDYVGPMRRPRLPSASEAPTVAPIPENLPLPDTPPRPALITVSTAPLLITHARTHSLTHALTHHTRTSSVCLFTS